LTGVTALLAERAANDRSGFDDPGPIRRVGHSLLDWLACAIAGVDEPPSRVFADFVRVQGARGVATVVGSADRTSPLLAAQANGLSSHALDFDDANPMMPGHPGIVLSAGLVALAEQRRSTGLQVALAFLAGYDSGCRVGALVAPGHYARGFHATGTIGTFPAAAACGRLIGLDAQRMRTAFGIAASTASGLTSMFGTGVKPPHAGDAAANGMAAELLDGVGIGSTRDDDPTADCSWD